MPEKSFSLVSYTAAVSLAVAALIYVFAPSSFLGSFRGGGQRRTSVVGLLNQANDCFINSILQVLVGLSALRAYLERETRRRDDGDLAVDRVQPSTLVPVPVPGGNDSGGGGGGARELPEWERRGLQQGLVTQALGQMLTALDEGPNHKKSISPHGFVSAFEDALHRRVNRQQQDAQEFLQKVADRLKDEYQAGQPAPPPCQPAPVPPPSSSPHSPATVTLQQSLPSDPVAPEDGFPMDGSFETVIECQMCNHKGKPRLEDFCMLVLHVPHIASTTLEACFDNVFKTEYIDDYKCDNCRLVQARDTLVHQRARAETDRDRTRAGAVLDLLDHVLADHPDSLPDHLEQFLGDPSLAPRSRIARFTRLTKFPRILAIHLSRSIYDSGRATLKNSAKVAFPELLMLGGILCNRSYRLSGLVTHSGSHNNGHYESFRRQPSTSDTSAPTPTPSSSEPVLSAKPRPPTVSFGLGLEPEDDGTEATGLRWTGPPVDSKRRPSSRAADDAAPSRRLRKNSRRPLDWWWRISDEIVQEARTSEVLSLQREVYLLFYELDTATAPAR